MHALGAECFFDFSANAWHPLSAAFCLSYTLWSATCLYLAFCPFLPEPGWLFTKIGCKELRDAWDLHPEAGPPASLIGYLTRKKSQWVPDNDKTGLFHVLVPEVFKMYENHGESAEKSLMAHNTSAYGLELRICNNKGLHDENASGEYMLIRSSLPAASMTEASSHEEIVLEQLKKLLRAFSGNNEVHPHQTCRGKPLGAAGRPDAFRFCRWANQSPEGIKCMLCGFGFD